MPDPIPPQIDQDYMMYEKQRGAMTKLIADPMTEPDLTPPAELLARRQAAREIAEKGGVELPPPGVDFPAIALPNLVAAKPLSGSTVTLEESELNDEVKNALAVLIKDEIVEQVDDHTWRFK